MIVMALFIGLAVGLPRLLTAGRRKAQLQSWREAARRVGLEGVTASDGGLVGVPTLGGRAAPAPLNVRLQPLSNRQQATGTTLVIAGLGHPPGGLTLRRDGLLGRTRRQIEVGIPVFDDEVFVQGDLPLALAVLDAKTRRLVAALMQGSLAIAGQEEPVAVEATVADGVLTVYLPEQAPDGERLAGVLAAALGIARRLMAPPDIPQRIAENLRREPKEAVELQCLQLLDRDFPDHPATREALLAALQDRGDEVRLWAARRLGEEGRETLLALATNPGTPDACAAQAVAALGPRLPAAPAEAALRRALTWKRHETARACLEALGRLRHAEAEGLMIEALGSDGFRVAVTACRALGRAGTAAAVAPLREAAEPAPRSELGQAAHKAIDEIQTRLIGAAQGQLTLADGEAGALSLAEGEPGWLSLAGDEAGEPGGLGRAEPLNLSPSADTIEAEDFASRPPWEAEPPQR
ncbi:MAG TPA: HEAT repeat domain-containing protein [Thermoanaerobaculia bacterium]|nr:HEAT repeat domain-containing protein [Thermoanaerobaculia bacterium]